MGSTWRSSNGSRLPLSEWLFLRLHDFLDERRKNHGKTFKRLCKTLMIKAPEFDRVYDGLSAKAVIRSVISQAIHTKSIPQIQQILESKRTKRIQRHQWLQWLNAMPRTNMYKQYAYAALSPAPSKCHAACCRSGWYLGAMSAGTTMWRQKNIEHEKTLIHRKT